MDLYHGKIRKGALNKTQGTQIRVCLWQRACVCVCLEETVVAPSFMNGKRAFVISSPYLVTVLYRRESFVYAAENKNVAAKPRDRNSPTLPSSTIYCLFFFLFFI